MEMSEEKKTKRIEEIKTTGEDLLKKVKEVLHEGNVRRLIIRDGAGKTLIEVPVTLGVVGILVAPTLAAIGVIAALVTDCSIIVEKE
jgi:hypothetical protein